MSEKSEKFAESSQIGFCFLFFAGAWNFSGCKGVGLDSGLVFV